MPTGKLFAVAIAVLLSIGFAPTKTTGIFKQSLDVGNPKLAGSAQYDKKTKEYRLKGADYNIWFERDEFQYLFKKGMAMRDPEDEIFSPEKNVQTIQIERKGDEYTMRVAKKGEALLVGLYICSHNPAKVEEAIVSNVRIVRSKP